MNFNLKENIVFEDKDILVINKPFDLVVHPDNNIANTHKYTTNSTNTNIFLTDYIVKEYPKIKNVGQSLRPGIVHRLDKDTSGLIVVAKTQQAYDYLIELFKLRKIEKKYYALVYGTLSPKQGVIAYSLEKKGKVRARLSETSKTALTRYKVIKEINDFSLLDVKIETGRTHQIRVHLAKIGHPIVGDQMYKFKRKQKVDLERQFLHAYYLRFKLLDGIEKVFQIELPNDLKLFLSELK